MLKKIAWGVVGVFGLGTAAYLYESWNKRWKKKYSVLKEKMKLTLSHEKVDGTIDPRMLARVVPCIYEEADKEYRVRYRALTAQRRKAFKERDFGEYMELAKESADVHQDINNDFMGYALSKLGLTFDEFLREIMKADPTLAQMLQMNRVIPSIPEGTTVPHGLTKNATRTIFMKMLMCEHDPQWAELIKMIHGSAGTKNTMERILKMMPLIDIFRADFLKTEHGYEVEQLELAKEEHRTMEDPAVINLLRRMTMSGQMTGGF
eukprot:TRINITY_DN3416_c0_g1_i3.p1 TRINITY_DN3416_c0_g1~~TRINITY_DN3416_c0_g1_i3.p1  ORF type:complete len:263 (+),score=108.36 TRINITY_DN3416_c0_g1_i3:153-941(+)